MAIVVREAHPDELDETARLLAVAFEQYRPAAELGDAFESYLADIVDVRSRLDHAELFVAVEERVIIGTATLYPPGEVAYPGAAPRTWPTGWASLRLLGVAPAARGRGVGRMLAEARIRRARELGASGLGLHTTRAFEASRRMYRRMGWKRAREYDFCPAPGLQAEAYVLALD
jgi:GNAT superfamily N-acetyltransferase